MTILFPYCYPYTKKRGNVFGIFPRVRKEKAGNGNFLQVECTNFQTKDERFLRFLACYEFNSSSRGYCPRKEH
jgi:hypothetical protein